METRKFEAVYSKDKKFVTIKSDDFDFLLSHVEHTKQYKRSGSLFDMLYGHCGEKFIYKHVVKKFETKDLLAKKEEIETIVVTLCGFAIRDNDLKIIITKDNCDNEHWFFEDGIYYDRHDAKDDGDKCALFPLNELSWDDYFEKQNVYDEPEEGEIVVALRNELCGSKSRWVSKIGCYVTNGIVDSAEDGEGFVFSNEFVFRLNDIKAIMDNKNSELPNYGCVVYSEFTQIVQCAINGIISACAYFSME